MRKQTIGKARIHRFENGKLRVIWKGREVTLKELRDEIDKLIKEEACVASAAVTKPT